MPTTPRVSAITIFLNAESYLEEAIESVRSQDFGEWELLLIDDGSTDRSTSIAKEYASRYPDHIRYYEHPGHANLGMSAARNLGLRHARGAYVAFLDGDDVWLPGKFAAQVPFMDAHPDVAMLIAATEYWYSWQGTNAPADEVKRIGLAPRRYDPPELAIRLYPLGTGTAPCQCSLLIRREAIERVGGYEDQFRGFYEDQAFLVKMYLSQRVAVSDDCWDRYRRHPASCSAVVRQQDTYDRHRETFFLWLREYLQRQPHIDKEVWDIVNDALRHQATGSAEPRWFRLLRVADGNSARLTYPEENPDAVRVVIDLAATGVSWDVQLNLPRLGVVGEHRYVLSFLARADEPRTLKVGCAQGHAPWDNLGLYEDLDVDTTWRSVECEFVATADDSNARVHFDLGERAVSVDISAITLRDRTAGCFVRPGQPVAADGSTNAVPNEPPVEVGRVNFGSLRRLTPLSEDFGCDRGRPVDRHYIEQFMASRADDIHGRVLEVGDRTYTRRYGGARVAHSDMLHIVEGEPEATIIADLASADHIGSDTFDCVILTQTLQLIYDFDAAIRTIYRILKPGGVLLATFPGISQSYDSEWGETWYWNFTGVSARRMFGDVFSPDGVTVQTFGNVLAAISFLQGLAIEELTAEELDYRDPGYDVTIAVRAQKPVARGPRPVRGEGSLQSGTEERGLILMYHRVAEPDVDPWGLAVSPSHFEQHLELLRDVAEVVPLSDLHAALGRTARPPVAITFDDGYADNALNAGPRLAASGCPATVFVTSGYIDEPREFWWDELEGILLRPGTLPETFALAVGGEPHHIRLGQSAIYTSSDARTHAAWRAPLDPPTERHAAYVRLWRALQPLTHAARADAIAAIRDWADVPAVIRPTHRPMTPAELVALAASGLVEIGAHTVTHPVLNVLPPDAQVEEIAASRQRLEELVGRPVTSFAYPYGAHTPAMVPRVLAAGFARACSTIPRAVSPGSSLYRLPRVEVGDWDGAELARRLQQWMPGRSVVVH